MKNFKEWLLKEDPDEIFGSKENITFRSGITFILFDNYYLYSKNEEWVMHEKIAEFIWQCRDSIQSALYGKFKQDVDRCLSYSVNTIGNINQKNLQQLKNTANLIDEKQQIEKSGKNFAAYRNLSLNKYPDIILGRIWPQHKIVSFWNISKIIENKKQDIIKFIKSVGQDPKQYKFEIQNKTIDYNIFIKNEIINKTTIDPSKIHALTPGETKTQLMKNMGFLMSKPKDITTTLNKQGD